MNGARRRGTVAADEDGAGDGSNVRIVGDELENPPENADDWTNEQWIEWLKATDATAESAESPVAGVMNRAAHSTGGQLLGAVMTGLANALYGPKKEKPAIVVETGEPGKDQPLELHLDPEDPEQSYAVLRKEDGSAV